MKGGVTSRPFHSGGVLALECSRRGAVDPHQFVEARARARPRRARRSAAPAGRRAGRRARCPCVPWPQSSPHWRSASTTGQQRLRPCRSANRRPCGGRAGRARARESRPRPSCASRLDRMLRAIPSPAWNCFEMLKPVQRAAKDQERPFLADQLDRRRQRAAQRRRLERVDGLDITAQWIRTPSLTTTKAQLNKNNSCALQLCCVISFYPQRKSETRNDPHLAALLAAPLVLPLPPPPPTFSARLTAPPPASGSSRATSAGAAARTPARARPKTAARWCSARTSPSAPAASKVSSPMAAPSAADRARQVQCVGQADRRPGARQALILSPRPRRHARAPGRPATPFRPFSRLRT